MLRITLKFETGAYDRMIAADEDGRADDLSVAAQDYVEAQELQQTA